MLRKSLAVPLLGILFSLGLHVTSAQAQATRTWVSGVGDDANPCSRTAPCKTFAGAISKTAARGEIDCLDPGGFGAVTITKSITIDCFAGMGGGVLASATNGIVVNAANVVVIIRNMTINGTGTTLGLNGITFIGSGQLHVENVRILDFSGNGINFAPNAASELYVQDTIVSEVGGVNNAGIFVKPTGNFAIGQLNRVQLTNNGGTGLTVDSTAMPGGSKLQIAVSDSVMSGNAGSGVNAGGGANTMRVQLARVTSSGNGASGVAASGAGTVVQLLNSVITQNTTGLSGSTITSFQSNVLSGNDANGAPTNTVPVQ
jgi:hypothetical protein